MGNTAFETVKFKEPVQVGGKEVSEIKVRTPTAGELRGCQMTMLLQMDVGQMFKVLPRVTTPAVTEADVEKMPPWALMALSTAVISFLNPGD